MNGATNDDDTTRGAFVIEQPVLNKQHERIGTCRIYVDDEVHAKQEVSAAPPHIPRTYRAISLAEVLQRKPEAHENILRARAEKRDALVLKG